MTRSAFTAPHVTEWLAVDVTETMGLVRLLRADPRWSGVRVNPMLFVAKALLIAVSRHQGVNARWDDANQEIVYHNYVNLGIAAATPRGLVVPNIKNADDLTLPELAGALAQLVETARAGKATPTDLSGGTITLTNIGALGVDAGTPILNPGEAAILAFGAVRPTPWVVDDQIAIRQITQLALTFDHRLVDGQLGSNVLTTVAAVLTEPVQALLYAPSK
jgi:2-oxoisovalerate dehydrogenase E2 component (dihydrolipoyl transacylase)